MKRFHIAIILALIPLLTQCEDREQRMLFDAAERTASSDPNACYTEEAYKLTIRFRPGTKLAKEAEARIDAMKHQ
jgi:hypothetical protein